MRIILENCTQLRSRKSLIDLRRKGLHVYTYVCCGKEYGSRVPADTRAVVVDVYFKSCNTWIDIHRVTDKIATRVNFRLRGGL